MGFPRNRCVQALAENQNSVQGALDWLTAVHADVPAAVPSTDTPQLLYLLSMGFPRNRCVQALAENQNSVQGALDWLTAVHADIPLVAPPSILPAAQFSFVDLIRCIHRDRLLVAQDTPGDGNCLFHALTSALHHLQQSVPGHRFPFGPLPLEHGRMRQVIVDFARDNCNVDGCFIDHSNSELKLSQYILVNMSTPDNAIIHGPNIRYRNVEHYFQVRTSS
jgi:hypothetical protein